ncbi:hypothetical protein BDQ17DRAFT_929179 [Cyathus striatus]|nr:hypothetical protein BDQ17DRAFT_929179 [Cyathus striatus]
MKFLYPASHIPSRLDDSLLALKIARHSDCSICTACHGLHPPTGVDVRLDEQFGESSLGDLEQYGSDDDDGLPASYLETCACGTTPDSIMQTKRNLVVRSLQGGVALLSV